MFQDDCHAQERVPHPPALDSPPITSRAASLAQHFDVTEASVYQWKTRSSFPDCSHMAQRL